jgi:hypothetical protein
MKNNYHAVDGGTQKPTPSDIDCSSILKIYHFSLISIILNSTSVDLFINYSLVHRNG